MFLSYNLVQKIPGNIVQIKNQDSPCHLTKFWNNWNEARNIKPL